MDFAVGETIFEKLHDMFEDIVHVQKQARRRASRVNIINDSFFLHQNHIHASSVDLIITSPPYLNNYHYNRNTRPHLYWLGFATQPQDLKHLEEANVGTYWQTMRELSRVDLEFSLPNSDLNERLQEIRFRNNDRGMYGGNGWANYAARYFNDCERFLKGVHAVLNAHGTALVVVGNSIIQGVLLPVDKYIGEIANMVGLELVHIDIPRTTRVGNSIIQSNVRVEKAIDDHQLYEAVVILRKR
jgi:DNA modification methylase